MFLISQLIFGLNDVDIFDKNTQFFFISALKLYNADFSIHQKLLNNQSLLDI